MTPNDTRERLELLYDAFAHRVHSHLARRIGPDLADDALTAVFTIARRRVDVLPERPAAWLLCAADQITRAQRDSWPRPELGESLPPRLGLALSRLDELERESLLMLGWDGLDIAEAAVVAGCSPRALRARLARSRARLAAELVNVHAAEVDALLRDSRPGDAASRSRAAALRESVVDLAMENLPAEFHRVSVG